VKADSVTIEKMRMFGELTGIAFQLKDDLFDYGSGDIGKPTGIDIKEQKMTLPLIYALSKASFMVKRKLINIVKNNNNDPDKVKYVIDYVLTSGGIEYTHQIMLDYRQRALDILHQFDDSEAKKSLQQLVMYTTERTK
jgi:octaprenyl-diphosphate synthase